MAHAFKNTNTSNSSFYNDGNGNSTFANINKTIFASDYITNKKAKLLYSSNFQKKRVGGLQNQNNLFLLRRAQLIRDIDVCNALPAFDTTNLVSGLYSTEDLSGVNVVTNVTADASNNVFCPTYSGSLIDPTLLLSPFYYTYNIDKCGSLFGNNICGIENYSHFKRYNKPEILSEQSLTKCENVKI